MKIVFIHIYIYYKYKQTVHPTTTSIIDVYSAVIDVRLVTYFANSAVTNI